MKVPEEWSELDPELYAELRQIAGRLMANQSDHHTLSPTDLVHESYLRIRGHGDWAGRTHILAHSAVAMRHALVDHARRKASEKRGGDHTRISLALAEKEASFDEDVLRVDDALNRLAEQHDRAARVVVLRIFGGLTAQEAADELQISKRTADDDWKFARHWLSAELEG